MSESNQPVESFESPEEVTDEQIAEFLGQPQAPEFHPILEVYRAVLDPAAEEATKKVTPQWANRITGSYREIDFADMVDFRDRFYAKVIQLRDILELEIASDPECLKPSTPDEDNAQNSTHYKNLLLLWQQAVLQWELDWDCQDPYAAIELAAISEVHKMFFGQNGFLSYLDNINFEFTEADQLMLAEALEEQKVGASE